MKRITTTLVLLGTLSLVFAFMPSSATAVDSAVTKERLDVPIVESDVTVSTTEAAPPDGGGREGDPDNTGDGLSVADSGSDALGWDEFEGIDDVTWEDYLLFLMYAFLPAP